MARAGRPAGLAAAGAGWHRRSLVAAVPPDHVIVPARCEDLYARLGPARDPMEGAFASTRSPVSTPAAPLEKAWSPGRFRGCAIGAGRGSETQPMGVAAWVRARPA